MILVVLVAIALGSAVSVLVAAAGEAGLRQSRELFLASAAEGAARAGVLGAMTGSWLDSTVVLGPGRVVNAGIVFPRPNIQVRLRAEWLAGNLWLLDGQAEVRAAAGQPQARGQLGIIVYVEFNPIDSSRSARPIGRGWVSGYQ